MSREFFAATLAKKPELLRAMLAFNGLRTLAPIPDVLSGFAHAELLWRMEPVRRRFGCSCTADPDFWDFEEEALRLAFLEATTMKRLAMTFGVAVMAPEICRLLRREDVRDARTRLGDALYAYALHRARFQVNGDVIPSTIRGPEDSPLDVRAYAVGVWGLQAIAVRWPDPLRSRFSLPDSPHSTDADYDLPPDTYRRLWVEIKRVLLKEVAPLWAPCFD